MKKSEIVKTNQSGRASDEGSTEDSSGKIKTRRSKMNLKPTEARDVVEPRSFPRVSYPILISIAESYKRLSWLCLVLGIILFVVLLIRGGEFALIGVIALIAGVILYTTCKVMYEKIILFTDISISAREILIHMTEKDARTDLLSDSDTSEVDSQ